MGCGTHKGAFDPVQFLQQCLLLAQTCGFFLDALQAACFFLKPACLQALFDCQQQVVGGKRFGDKIVCATLHGLHGQLHCGKAGDDDANHIWVVRQDGLQQAYAADVRHHHVQEHQGKTVLLNLGQPFLACGCNLHLVAMGRQRPLAARSYTGFVVNDQDTVPLFHGLSFLLLHPQKTAMGERR